MQAQGAGGSGLHSPVQPVDTHAPLMTWQPPPGFFAITWAALIITQASRTTISTILVIVCIRLISSLFVGFVQILSSKRTYGDKVRALVLGSKPGCCDKNCAAEFAASGVRRPSQTSSTLPFSPTATT